MASIGYLELIRTNSSFRKVWLGSVISMLGEWFNTIALFLIILEYTGNEFLLGVLFTVRMLSFAVLQPVIGVLADRMNRKHLMLFSDLLSALLALAFLLVDDGNDMYLLITLTGLMMLMHGLFVTCERAAIPNLVDAEHLDTANALDAASWSTALCIGALLGGIVVSTFGTNAAFIIDSLTFLVSFLFILSTPIPQEISKQKDQSILNAGINNFIEGWQRINREGRLKRIVFAKASWNIAGGGLAGVFLVLLGANVDGFGAAFGFGLFFFARGIGTGLGPIIIRNIAPESSKWPTLVGQLIILSGMFYLFATLSLGFVLWLTVLLVILAHSASGANWVLSTILTQQWVEDEVRGRVFSADMLFLSIAFSISTTIAGYIVEYRIVTIQEGMVIFSCIMMLSGLFFTKWNPTTLRESNR